MKTSDILFLFTLNFVFAQQESRTIINLNVIWEFDQTINAFPPVKLKRAIPIPGLVHLATPKIDDYDKFFKREDKVVSGNQQKISKDKYSCRLFIFSNKPILEMNHLNMKKSTVV